MEDFEGGPRILPKFWVHRLLRARTLTERKGSVHLQTLSAGSALGFDERQTSSSDFQTEVEGAITQARHNYRVA